jgi:hypothetical protein
MNERLLESRIAALRGQVRRLLVLHGVSLVLAGLIPLLVLAGLLDWIFHLDIFVRVALLITLTGFTGWVGYRWIVRPMIVRFADLDIAMKIEQRWPGLHDRLASTIQFLRVKADDDRYGSSTLREATIRRAMQETESLDFREAIEYRPIYQAVGLATLALSVAAIIGLMAPGTARLALRRLLVPWGGDLWPQSTHLALNEAGTTLKIARGDAFTLSVKVKPGDTVPETARVHYHFTDGDESVEPLRSVEGGEFVGRLETVNQPFHFSVTGGDDLTSIRDVEVKVVPPPAINRLTVRLESPEYTGLAPQVLAAGLTSFRALEGTRIVLDGQANKPLREAVLHLGDAHAGQSVAFEPNRRAFGVSFPVKDSLAFWFGLEDDEGFRNRDSVRYDVRMLKDESPRVLIDEPKADRDVPPDAVIPVRIDLEDDFGLQSCRLLYVTSSGDSEPHEAVAIPLWSAPAIESGQSQNRSIKHQELSHEWNLSPLKLGVGSFITFHAEARDFDSINGPKTGKSREIRLRIVSKEDAARQFDDSRRELREEIARVLAMQRQAITPVDEAIRTLQKTDTMPRPQRENLNNSALIQRQVGSRLSNQDEGLEQRLRLMLDDLRNFKIANPDAELQLRQMLERLQGVRDRHAEQAEQSLTRANKSLERKAEDSSIRPEAMPGQPRTAPPKAGDSTRSNASQAGEPETGKSATGKSENSPSQSAKNSNSKSESRDSEAPKTSSRDAAGKGESNQGKAPDLATKSKDDPSSGLPASKQQPGRDEPKAAGSDSQRKPETGNSEKPTNPSEMARQSLADARKDQQSIADELKRMLDGLSEFETYRGVVKDAQTLLKQQEETMKQAADAATRPDLMGKSPETLTPEQKADLDNMAARQSDLSKNLQNLLERMDELAKNLDESDPLAASAMREAANENRQKGTGAKMNEAAERLQRNQMGQARSRQEASRQELRDLVDSLENRREKELARLVKELKNAESEMKELRRRQAQNLKATREAKQNPNAQERKEQLKRLSKEQEQIQQELKRQLQKLAKLNAERAARAGQQASGKMGKAQQQLDQDQGDDADQNEEEALADLNDAQDELEEMRREAEERLAMEQLARMGDQLRSLAERQEKMVGETENYEKLRLKGEGKLTIAQRAGVRGLGQIQTGLKEETNGLIEQLEGAPVFTLTLRRAVEEMDDAAIRLQGLKTDEETQRAVRSASHRFQQLIESLRSDSDKNGQAGGGGGGGGGGGAAGGGGNSDGIPPTAQLKMLKTLQKEINEKTEALDELKRRKKELSSAQSKEAEKLAEDQGALADLVRDMTRPKRDDGEE